MVASLEAIANNADQKQRLTQYKESLGDAVSRGGVEECKAFVDHRACVVRVCLCEWGCVGDQQGGT